MFARRRSNGHIHGSVSGLSLDWHDYRDSHGQKKEMNEKDLYLSQWVETSHTLTRRSVYSGKAWKKKWVRGECARQGVIVGIRHLTNGRNEINGGEVTYIHEEFLVAALISYDLKRKPVLALLHDIKEYD